MMLDCFSRSVDQKKKKNHIDYGFADLLVGKKIVHAEGKMDYGGNVLPDQFLTLTFDTGDVLNIKFERVRYSFKNKKERIKEIHTEIIKISHEHERLCKELNKLL